MFKKKYLVTLNMSPDARKRLDDLKKTCETTSDSDIFKNALKLFEAMVKKAEAGAEFYIKEPGSDKIIKYNVFESDASAGDYRQAIGARADTASGVAPGL